MEVLRPVGRVWDRARRRHGWLDHAVRAGVRHGEVRAGRMAAACAYYGFFAVFALSALGFAVLGWTLRHDGDATGVVRRYLDQYLPGVDVGAIAEASAGIGLIALAGLVVVGLAWVRALRSAVRAVWRLDERPGGLLVRLGVDLAVLVSLGLLLLVSVGVAVGISAVVRWVVEAGGIQGSPSRLFIASVGFVVGLMVNTILATAMLTGLPRLTMPARRVLWPALLVAVSLELLKTAGGLYFQRSMDNPAYQAVASAVGVLLFMYLLNQVVLYAAALTATSEYGEAVDRAGGRPRGAMVTGGR